MECVATTDRKTNCDILERTEFLNAALNNPKMYYLHYHVLNRKDMDRAAMKDYTCGANFTADTELIRH